HFTVADFTAKTRAAGRADRPIWTVPQFFKFTSDSRMLTAGELRSHAVMAIVQGAHGRVSWDIGVNGRRHLDAAAEAASVVGAQVRLPAAAGDPHVAECRQQRERVEGRALAARQWRIVERHLRAL